MINMELRICASQAPFGTLQINFHITSMEPQIDVVRSLSFLYSSNCMKLKCFHLKAIKLLKLKINRCNCSHR